MVRSRVLVALGWIGKSDATEGNVLEGLSNSGRRSGRPGNCSELVRTGKEVIF